MNPLILILAATPSTTPISAPSLNELLAAQAPAPAPAAAKWTGSVNVGASYSDGNTNSQAANAAADAERRGEKDRHTLKGFWNYAEQEVGGESTITERRAGLSYKYDYFLAKKTFLFGTGEASTDLGLDISERFIVGGGVGEQWKETDTFKWSSELGVSYFTEDYRTATDPDGKDYIAARIANVIAYKFNDKTSIDNTIDVYPSLEEADDVYGKSDTKVKTSLTEKMFAQLQWVFQYDNTPVGDRERQDNQLILGIGWSF